MDTLLAFSIAANKILHLVHFWVRHLLLLDGQSGCNGILGCSVQLTPCMANMENS